MNLFQRGNFGLHSGAQSRWKIVCDALTDDDLATLAERVAEKLSFGTVVGVPTGGNRFAKFLRNYSDPHKGILIADDVLTTGKSMAEMRLKFPDAAGVVIFARGPCPAWVWPLFHCTIGESP